MKKYIFAAALLSTLFSCGSADQKKASGKDITEDPAYSKGLALVAKNKCLTCHSVTETITGPPYSEIAKKYASFSDTIVTHLAHKVINGGNGVWGEIFMTPHPDVSEADAETMVKYILLLK